MNLKRLLLLLTLGIILFSSKSYTQDYKSAIGARLLYGINGTFKHYISEKGAVDLTAGFWGYGVGYGAFDIGLCYQHDVYRFEDVIEGLKVHVGGGPYFFSWTGDYGTLYDGRGNIGLMLNAGLEYTFTDIPLTVATDYSPGYNITGYGHFWPHGGLSVRYVLGGGGMKKK